MFEDLQFLGLLTFPIYFPYIIPSLAGCWNINLMKAPQNFEEIYPEMCKEYFDVLAKKRFNSEEKGQLGSRKKTKSVLECFLQRASVLHFSSPSISKDLSWSHEF